MVWSRVPSAAQPKSLQSRQHAVQSIDSFKLRTLFIIGVRWTVLVNITAFCWTTISNETTEQLQPP